MIYDEAVRKNATQCAILLCPGEQTEDNGMWGQVDGQGVFLGALNEKNSSDWMAIFGDGQKLTD